MSRRPFVREVPKTSWFLRQPRYLRYMARELTCVFIGAYAVLLLVALVRLADGRDAYDAFLQALGSPAGVAFLLVTLGFSVYHSVTWFNVTPKAMPIRVGEKSVPDGVIVGAHYAGWGVLTLALLTLAGAL